MLGILKLRKRNIVSVFFIQISCFLVLWGRSVFYLYKGCGACRDRVKYEDSKNYRLKSSDRNRFVSVSKYCTDVALV